MERLTEQLRKKREDEGGFTLIELLVVIIILGVLSAVVVFAVTGTGDKGKGAAIKTDKSTLITAEQAYCAKTGTFGTEDQLTGAVPVTGSNPPEFVKFLSEPSVTHDVKLTGGGFCGSDPLADNSGFLITGDAAANPTAGGQFTVGVPDSNPAGTALPTKGTLNPAVSTSGGMQQMSGLLFNGLVGIDRNSNPVPELAQSWTVAENTPNPGNQRVTFTLRPGLKFSDGTDVTAADVKFSYEAALLIWHARTSNTLATPGVLSPGCTDPTPGAGTGRRLGCGAIFPDDTVATARTVSFTFTKPYGPLFQQLAHTDGAIIPQSVWPTCLTNTNTGACPGPGGSNPAKPWPIVAGNPVNPVGTGPYRFVSQLGTGNGTDLIYEKNPFFWRTGGVPYFPTVDWKVITSATALQSLQTGAVDWLWSVPASGLTTARNDSSLVVDSGSISAGGSTSCVLKVIFNLKARGATPATVQAGTATANVKVGDVKVRQAIAKALQRKPGVFPVAAPTNTGYVTNVQGDDGSRLAPAPFHANLLGSSPQALPDFDLTGANTLIDQVVVAAGGTAWNGTGFRAVGNGATAAMVGTDPNFRLDIAGFLGQQDALASAIRDDLVQVGIEVTRNADPSALTAGGFAAVTTSAMNSLYSNRQFDSLLFSNCQATDAEIGAGRVYRSTAITGAPFTNGAGYRNLTVDGWFNEARDSLDPVLRADRYAKIQQQLATDLPTLWIFETVSNRAYRATCAGLRPWTGHFAEYGSCLR